MLSNATYLRSSQQQVLMPPCELLSFLLLLLLLSCKYPAKLTSIQTSKCQQHCSSEMHGAALNLITHDQSGNFQQFDSVSELEWDQRACCCSAPLKQLIEKSFFGAFAWFDAAIAVSLRLTPITGAGQLYSITCGKLDYQGIRCKSSKKCCVFPVESWKTREVEWRQKAAANETWLVIQIYGNFINYSNPSFICTIRWWSN